VPRPAHTLVTFEGTTGAVTAPIDIWSFSVKFVDNRWTTTDPLVPLAFKDFWTTHFAPLHGSLIHLRKVRIAAVTGLGKVNRTASGAYLQQDWVGDVPGQGAVTTFLPPQCSVVVSLSTERQDATGKGRFFLPQTKYPIVGSDFRMSVVDTTDITTKARAFLNAMRDYNPAATTFAGDPAAQVVSSKGYVSKVTTVRVGRAVDTIRSRRSELPEGYVSLAL